MVPNEKIANNTRPKVCHFSSVHHVWDTRVFYRECVSLAKEFDVTLIAIGKGDFVKQGVHVIGITKPKNIFYRFFITVFHVFILAVKQDAQIYHIHDAEMIPFGIVLSILGKKVIYDIHENTYDDILLKPWVNKALRLFLARTYNALLWFGSKFMHYIIVVADPKFLNKFFVAAEECTIIQNFADPKDWEPYLVKNRSELPGNHIFYVGMIRDMYYHIDTVLEAIYKLKGEGFLCELHLLGYFGSRTNSSFSNLPFWNEIKSQIHFYGFLEKEEAYQISMKCKVGLCIKNQPESMLVSHERKWFEYMCIGLPSVFCNREIYTSINTKFELGVAVNLEDANEIARTLKSILCDPTKQKSFALNNILAANAQFNWQLEAKKLTSLYWKLLPFA